MIAESLQKLKEIKSDIKDALIDQGAEVGDKFEEYAGAILQLGGGPATFKVPKGMKFSNSTIERFPKEFDWSDSKNWTDYVSMFYYCRSLLEHPILDTSSATNLSNLFYSNERLSVLPE